MCTCLHYFLQGFALPAPTNLQALWLFLEWECHIFQKTEAFATLDIIGSGLVSLGLFRATALPLTGVLPRIQHSNNLMKNRPKTNSELPVMS